MSGRLNCQTISSSLHKNGIISNLLGTGIPEARGLNLVMYEARDITIGLHDGSCNNVGSPSRAMWYMYSIAKESFGFSYSCFPKVAFLAWVRSHQCPLFPFHPLISPYITTSNLFSYNCAYFLSRPPSFTVFWEYTFVSAGFITT